MKWTLGIDLWNLFFPRTCRVCGRILCPQEEVVCATCLCRLPRTRFHERSDNPVEQHFWGKFPLVRATSFFYYSKGGSARQLLYELKYHGHPEVGVFLGKLLAMELRMSGFFDGVDLLLPIPLHPRRQRERGYNQSERIAAGISAVTGLPVVLDGVVRSRYTETQTHKGAYERWRNVQQLFVCPDTSRFEGKHVLLLDDVLTTGATLVSCADTLREIPGIRLSVLTVAVAGES